MEDRVRVCQGPPRSPSPSSPVRGAWTDLPFPSPGWFQAAKALRACPLTYEHPEQAIELTGVGPMIVGMLVTRLRKHCEQTGEVFPERGKSFSSYRSSHLLVTYLSSPSLPRSWQQAQVARRKRAGRGGCSARGCQAHSAQWRRGGGLEDSSATICSVRLRCTCEEGQGAGEAARVSSTPFAAIRHRRIRPPPCQLTWRPSLHLLTRQVRPQGTLRCIRHPPRAVRQFFVRRAGALDAQGGAYPARDAALGGTVRQGHDFCGRWCSVQCGIPHCLG